MTEHAKDRLLERYGIHDSEAVKTHIQEIGSVKLLECRRKAYIYKTFYFGRSLYYVADQGHRITTFFTEEMVLSKYSSRTTKTIHVPFSNRDKSVKSKTLSDTEKRMAFERKRKLRQAGFKMFPK